MNGAGQEYTVQALTWLLVWAVAGVNVRGFLARREAESDELRRRESGGNS